MLQMYSMEKMQITKAMENPTAGISAINAEDVTNCVEHLMGLEHHGARIKELFKSQSSARKSENKSSVREFVYRDKRKKRDVHAKASQNKGEESVSGNSETQILEITNGPLSISFTNKRGARDESRMSSSDVYDRRSSSSRSEPPTRQEGDHHDGRDLSQGRQQHERQQQGGYPRGRGFHYQSYNRPFNHQNYQGSRYPSEQPPPNYQDAMGYPLYQQPYNPNRGRGGYSNRGGNFPNRQNFRNPRSEHPYQHPRHFGGTFNPNYYNRGNMDADNSFNPNQNQGFYNPRAGYHRQNFGGNIPIEGSQFNRNSFNPNENQRGLRWRGSGGMHHNSTFEGSRRHQSLAQSEENRSDGSTGTRPKYPQPSRDGRRRFVKSGGYAKGTEQGNKITAFIQSSSSSDTTSSDDSDDSKSFLSVDDHL